MKKKTKRAKKKSALLSYCPVSTDKEAWRELNVPPTPRRRNIGIEIEFSLDKYRVFEEDIFTYKGLPAFIEIQRRVPGRAALAIDDGALEASSRPFPTRISAYKYLNDLLAPRLPVYKEMLPIHGMHVHLSTYKMTIEHQIRLRDFIYYHRKFLENWVSDRPKATYSSLKQRHFSRRNEINYIKNKEECYLGNAFILNTQYGTNEFKLFKSTTDPFVAKANVDFCLAITDYTKVSSNSLTKLQDFLNFVTKNRRSYPYIYRFFLYNKKHIKKVYCSP